MSHLLLSLYMSLALAAVFRLPRVELIQPSLYVSAVQVLMNAFVLDAGADTRALCAETLAVVCAADGTALPLLIDSLNLGDVLKRRIGTSHCFRFFGKLFVYFVRF